MHNNYLSVWSVLYCDMSQALYKHLQTVHVQSQTQYNTLQYHTFPIQ